MVSGKVVRRVRVWSPKVWSLVAWKVTATDWRLDYGRELKMVRLELRVQSTVTEMERGMVFGMELKTVRVEPMVQ